MFAQLFGQYLLSCGIVSAAELQLGMEAQRHTRPKIGVMAVSEGYMTPDQVAIVHQEQTRVDRRFGEIAVDLGYLSEEQVNAMLAMQLPEHIALGQALIDQEVMNYEDLSFALKQYREANELPIDRLEMIVNGDTDALVEMVISAGAMVGKEAIQYIALFARNVVRFIDSEATLEPVKKDTVTYDWIASQPLMNSNGDVRQTAIGGSRQSMLQLASLFAQETIEETNEWFIASVGEFLNLHNGIYLVNLSDSGKELRMGPQNVDAGSRVAPQIPSYIAARIRGTSFEVDLLVPDLSDLPN